MTNQEKSYRNLSDFFQDDFHMTYSSTSLDRPAYVERDRALYQLGNSLVKGVRLLHFYDYSQTDGRPVDLDKSRWLNWTLKERDGSPVSKGNLVFRSVESPVE